MARRPAAAPIPPALVVAEAPAAAAVAKRKRLGKGKVKTLTHAEIMILLDVADHAQASVSDLLYRVTVAEGKAVTYGQISAPVKSLADKGLIVSEQIKSTENGRTVDRYSCTDEGLQAKELLSQLSQLIE